MPIQNDVITLQQVVKVSLHTRKRSRVGANVQLGFIMQVTYR